MSKQDKEVVDTTELDAKIKEVSEKIQALLEEAEVALQPFMQYTEFGIAPRVRLVENKIETYVDQDGNSNKVSDAEITEPTTQSEPS